MGVVDVVQVFAPSAFFNQSDHANGMFKSYAGALVEDFRVPHGYSRRLLPSSLAGEDVCCCLERLHVVVVVVAGRRRRVVMTGLSYRYTLCGGDAVLQQLSFTTGS